MTLPPTPAERLRTRGALAAALLAASAALWPGAPLLVVLSNARTMPRLDLYCAAGATLAMLGRLLVASRPTAATSPEPVVHALARAASLNLLLLMFFSGLSFSVENPPVAFWCLGCVLASDVCVVVAQRRPAGRGRRGFDVVSRPASPPVADHRGEPQRHEQADHQQD